MRRRHRVDSQKIKRRRAIDQHVGEVCLVRYARLKRRQRVAQTIGAIARLTDFKLEAGEIECRWRKMKSRHRGRDDRVAQCRLAGQHVVSRVAAAAPINAKTGRGIALRVEIDDQHLFADGGERGAEVDRCRRLADPALLVRDCEHRARRAGDPRLNRKRRRCVEDGCFAHRWPASLLPRGVWHETPHDNDLAPGVGPALDQAELNSPTFSGFGQFRPHILTLGKQAECALPQQRIGHRKELRQWSQGPCGHDIECLHRFFRKLLDAHLRAPLRGAPVACAASRRKAAFFPLLSTRCISAPGLSAIAQAMTMPGNPPPEPRSAHMRASGASGRSWSESATWRVQTVASVERAIKFIRCCQASSVAIKRSRRSVVSRETGVSCQRPVAIDRKLLGRQLDCGDTGLVPVSARGSHAAPRVGFRPFRRRCATSSVNAAGVMPSRRPAWPMVRGRWACSLCRTSFDSPGNAA